MANLVKTNSSLEKLKSLLIKLFQFDVTELDFGIYRIMNYKRKEIENFIEKDLIQAVEKEFERYKTQSFRGLSQKIEEKERKIREDFGSDILKDRTLITKFGETKLVKDYLELKKQLEDVEVAGNIKSQVFNDLYNFFSRYYEDGDFISKRRYSSKNEKYAIPYNGEEVKFYWANFNQYYVKTEEVFKDYEFSLKDWRIIFRTIFAEVDTGNIKGERRYFVLAKDDSVRIDNKQKECFIQFEYRPLTYEDSKEYKVKTKTGEEKKIGIQQDELNSILEDKILEQIKEIELKAMLSEKEEEKTILRKHLYKYTRKITSDFFIHKNLKSFLEREIDYFIKTEVIDLNNLEPKHMTRASVVEGIGKRIIEFLTQIEEFQKILWEKKKFISKTDYVITIDRIPEEFHKEILENKNQLKEWEDLKFGKAKTKKDLNGKKLPVDTKYFSEDFKERLLEELSEQGNIDNLIDGVLIKSENWQALNLILGKYSEKIQCIYIDPPFNTGTNEFLYKNKFLDSSWIAMMYDRLDLGRKVLKDDGSIYVRIDYHGNHYVRSLMDMIFGTENHKNEILVSRTKEFFKSFKGIGKFMVANDYLLFYTKTQKALFKEIRVKREKEVWWELTLPGESEDNIRIVFGKRMKAPPGRQWGLKQNQIDEYVRLGRIKVQNSKVMYSPIDKGIDSNWTGISGYSRNWKKETNLTENSEILLQRVIEATTNKGDWVFDYFLGSGTTIAVAHKLSRQWIGVEMGEFFENIPLERMKMTLYGEKTGISKEVNWQGGGFFKYHYLEQYEDTLHNIEFTQGDKGQKVLELFGKGEEENEYLMKYFLKYETQGSPSLLNLKQFENPFGYKLKIISGNKGEEIVSVDLVETFNYLVGLDVNRYKFLEYNKRKYVIALGERNHRKIAIVWRPTKKIDLEKDKEIIEDGIRNFNPEEIYINGDSLIKNYKVIESEFKALMGV